MHHGSLYYSLQLLAKRLGQRIVRPIGLDWFEQGYWKIAEPYGNHPDTIKQYLSTEPYERVKFYCNTNAREVKQGVYLIEDLAHENKHHAVTLDAAIKLQPEIIICSYGPHMPAWRQMQQRFFPNSKFVMQEGNAGWEQYYDLTDNLLSSCKHQITPNVANTVEYHQEFPLSIFKPKKPFIVPYITSFVNCLPRAEYYEALRKLLKDTFLCSAFGAACPDGPITGITKMAHIMQDSMWGYHVKPGGDGYGHVLHNWFAVGRPVLTFIEDYQGKLGGDLLIPDVTCIALSGDPVKDAERILSINDVDYYQMVQNVQNRFRQIVDFDKEEVALRKFFEQLI